MMKNFEGSLLAKIIWVCDQFESARLILMKFCGVLLALFVELLKSFFPNFPYFRLNSFSNGKRLRFIFYLNLVRIKIYSLIEITWRVLIEFGHFGPTSNGLIIKGETLLLIGLLLGFHLLSKALLVYYNLKFKLSFGGVKILTYFSFKYMNQTKISGRNK